eukprot:gnl/TRDRNA2_/TRDRNA2_170262_c1_seq3.p1 gnl/TRDRNA2_/TRDRNA2_170262_c1~~gnl/TRDRNA2_/TRDRNA2_170262_c1_seq3.p1  ORF type:complete len:119 (-),score=17.71 gnl/TRDRNA2_/TRDRNA2_170262_c1_seq3:39-395(-)
MASAIGRPFAGAVAGRTISSDFDIDTQRFSLAYHCKRTTDSAPTEIVVPGYWLKAENLVVTVEGDVDAKSWQVRHTGRQVVEGTEILSWRTVHVQHSVAAAKAGGIIHVTVAPERYVT